ncbi:hypothetical protein IF1G_01096 [Cordyceps javanica]|uniref:Uncharacterized protein n=1 Tax=Cordyceps javanica TaxID=43265 RepID=A0A545VHG4_9HYPO|nr:hypothetical protein IF1G_01096 [Cordyceps javanica]
MLPLVLQLRMSIRHDLAGQFPAPLPPRASGRATSILGTRSNCLVTLVVKLVFDCHDEVRSQRYPRANATAKATTQTQRCFA